jgi:hypothetical protein
MNEAINNPKVLDLRLPRGPSNHNILDILHKLLPAEPSAMAMPWSLSTVAV